MPTPTELAAMRANLAFTCTRETDRHPPLNPEADQLFKYARYLQKADGPKDFNTVARYYRIAAAYGHYKANHNLQLLVSEGFADSPNRSKETIDLVEQLIKDGIPGGYYDMGRYLELGYGVEQNQEKALQYFRKAADFGNPEAQYYVADKLTSAKDADAFAVGMQMYRCAAEQGYGQAANFLGVMLQDLGDGSGGADADNAKAVEAFQKGVAAGNGKSAAILEEAFEAPSPGSLGHLDLQSDPDRSRRYREIRLFFRRNDGRNPKVPDIDQIVPLPPAPLPEWDGTFQWEKEQAAATPPPQPSEELIQRLAKAKNLDPATGLPIPPPPKAALGTRAQTGERCPEHGEWCVRFNDGFRSHDRYTFTKGETLPTYAAYRPRRFDLFDVLENLFGMRYEQVAVTWELVGYGKEPVA
ncbi:SEL1-like repeat protein [Dyella japonica]|uniref:DUF6396 domain-containing protein n=1 Tax=Dyella japonica A8 TaxID=1217721 RepID=A0A075JY09_9GAMM|nr:sel1 repeat family protein [Dyella japonica]AIF46971.1 hypothetical protein HY57_06665 [Dyella japonica A8]